MSELIDLSVRLSRTPETTVARVSIRGELDMSTSVTLRSQLRMLERRQPSVIVLDIAELRFMDVAGLRTVLDAARRAARDGRRLLVVNPLPAILRLFELTAIDQTLDVVREPVAPVA